MIKFTFINTFIIGQSVFMEIQTGNIYMVDNEIAIKYIEGNVYHDKFGIQF